MKTNIKAPWIVVIFTAFVLLILLVWISVHTARQNIRYFEHAVTNGLTNMYVEISNTTTNRSGQHPVVLSKEELSMILLDETRPRSYLLGLTSQSNIYIPSSGITLGTTNLLCVINTGETLWSGIDATGRCRGVSQAELQVWPHTSLSSFSH